jgi:hypothetical protein
MRREVLSERKDRPMAKKPPVPNENRSPKGTGSAPEPKDGERRKSPGNLAEQDQQGNIRQNTRNQGYQQDR